jgi:prepilin-type N-terminal cleavage/methylation domain-containing protein
MARGRHEAGFTLIEVLIAVTLLGLLTTGMMIALRVALNAQTHASAKILDNRRVMGAQRAIEQELNGFMPETAAWIPPGSSGGAQQVPFFEGDPNAMRLISSYSLNGADRGLPQILEFLTIPGDNGQGVRLIVNERPWNGPWSGSDLIAGVEPGVAGIHAVFFPIQVGSNSFVLADRLAFCRMLYLGINRQVAPPRREWRADWESREWPLAVRIEMAPLGGDAAGLHTVTVTAALHAARSPDITYSDYLPK